MNNEIEKSPIDPLRRVFIPIEKRNLDGSLVFQTHDRTKYTRAEDGGPMRRVIPKIRGKKARHAEKIARRVNART